MVNRKGSAVGINPLPVYKHPPFGGHKIANLRINHFECCCWHLILLIVFNPRRQPELDWRENGLPARAAYSESVSGSPVFESADKPSRRVAGRSQGGRQRIYDRLVSCKGCSSFIVGRR